MSEVATRRTSVIVAADVYRNRDAVQRHDGSIHGEIQLEGRCAGDEGASSRTAVRRDDHHVRNRACAVRQNTGAASALNDDRAGRAARIVGAALDEPAFDRHTGASAGLILKRRGIRRGRASNDDAVGAQVQGADCSTSVMGTSRVDNRLPVALNSCSSKTAGPGSSPTPE